MTKSPQKKVPNVGIRLGAACKQTGIRSSYRAQCFRQRKTALAEKYLSILGMTCNILHYYAWSWEYFRNLVSKFVYNMLSHQSMWKLPECLTIPVNFPFVLQKISVCPVTLRKSQILLTDIIYEIPALGMKLAFGIKGAIVNGFWTL